GGKPARLIVGHAWGASVFELLPGKQPKRVRLLTGHEGEVMALAVSADPKKGVVLVTAGRDQTIAGWSLEDWPSHPTFGARIVPASGELVVNSVDPGSPAWEMGLMPGDKIIHVTVGDVANPASVVYDKTAKSGQKAYDGALEALRDPKPGEQLVLKW